MPDTNGIADLNEFFRRHGWPKTREEFIRAKEAVESAEVKANHERRCFELRLHLKAADAMLKAGRFDEAVARVRQAIGGEK